MYSPNIYMSEVYLISTAWITEAAPRSAHTEGTAKLAETHCHSLQVVVNLVSVLPPQGVCH